MKYTPPLLIHAAGLPGPLCEYDHQTMPSAINMLDYIKSQPDYEHGFWAWLLGKNKTKPLSVAVEENRNLLGWSSFAWRNPRHEISKQIANEFFRVYGRNLNLHDR